MSDDKQDKSKTLRLWEILGCGLFEGQNGDCGVTVSKQTVENGEKFIVYTVTRPSASSVKNPTLVLNRGAGGVLASYLNDNFTEDPITGNKVVLYQKEGGPQLDFSKLPISIQSRMQHEFNEGILIALSYAERMLEQYCDPNAAYTPNKKE